MDDLCNCQRWRDGTLTAMGIALFVGFLTLIPEGRWSYVPIETILSEAATAICITFWAIFALMYFCHIRKSAATVEYQREVQRGELEVIARARALPRRTAPRSPTG